MRRRIRSVVRRLRSAPVIGHAVRALDRVWWARTISASPLVDPEYYAAQCGRRVIGRRAAVVHYVARGFRRGMSLNPLFDETLAGGELPEVLRVPALYAYLISERHTVAVNPWWDAPAFGAGQAGNEIPPLEQAWSDPETELTLRVGEASTTVTVRDFRVAALAAARDWRGSRVVRGAPADGGEWSVIRVVQARDRRYHRKLDQVARMTAGVDDARGVVSMVAVDASQWVSGVLMRLVVPAVTVRSHRRADTWSSVVGAAATSLTASTLVVLDARAELSDSELRSLVGAASGALAAPAHRRQDGTLYGVGAASVGVGRPYRMLEEHPQEDLDVVTGDVIDVPLLTGRTFAASRTLFERAGGFDRSLTNDAELESLSAAVRVVEPSTQIRVLSSIRPVLDEPEIAFARRRPRANARALAASRFAEGRLEAEELLRAAGFRVLSWRTVGEGDSPTPRLEWVRPHEGALRWSLKICAPAGRQGAVWGDTHFAQGLARALRRRGHMVVIDAFDARARSTDYLDDVSVAVRGPYRIDPPSTGVRLQWIISHPDEITRGEVASFDRVYAASHRWSERVSREWGVAVAPLLECTDTDLFHPRGLSRGSDIVFVGTARGIPRPSVVGPVNAGVPVRVYGPDWRPFVPQSALAARSIPHSELPMRYETASVVLNDQWPAMRREGFLAMRPFDVVAVGGRVISEDVDGIAEIFEGAVVTYRDVEHLVSLLRADPATIFPDDAKLARISSRIREEHSFDARAEVLDQAAVQVIGERQIRPNRAGGESR